MTQQLRAAKETLVGSVLLGRYRVVRELAKGGMGVVYLARAEGAVGFVKPVVIKLLLPEHNEDERMVRMFVREARILSQLRHPSLVDVLEFGEQDGAYILVLEYVRGYHLGLWLRYLALQKREAPADILLQIVIDVLDALHHAHTQTHPDGSSMQIVHRDVSPSNILLDEGGRARLLDFGVARMRGGGLDYKTHVQGGFMGKLPYTAPELFSGGEASPKSDLYACAVVLHEAMFGHNVFRAETQAATLQRVLTRAPEAIEPVRADAPRGLDSVLGSALNKVIDARHADAGELAGALRNLQTRSESELRARLAELLKNDFGSEMSQLLNLESLADRDAAWRAGADESKVSEATRGSQHPPPANTNAAAGRAAPNTPLPLGATVNTNPRIGRTTTGRFAQPQLPPETPSTEPELSTAKQQPRAADTSRPTQPVPRVYMEVTPHVPDQVVPDAAKPPTHPPPHEHSSVWPLAAAVFCVTALVGMVIWPEARVPHQAPPPARVQPQPEPPPPVKPPVAVNPPTTPKLPASTDPDKQPDRDKKRAPDANALTRALRKQQPRLEACFRQHSVSLEGNATTQLVFDLDANGKLTRVELSPQMLTGTSLGQCLLKVARSTPFPAQPRAVSFVIPLTARTSPDG